MGQHKTNPKAILAKKGLIEPKKRSTLTNEQLRTLYMTEFFDRIFGRAPSKGVANEQKI